MLDRKVLGYLGAAMLTRLLTRLFRVRLASTDAEREAIYRFRYAVFAAELRRTGIGEDHERRTVRSADDEHPSVHHLYVGTPDDMLGAVRFKVFRPGELTLDTYDPQQISPDLLPFSDRYTFAHLGRFMIRGDRRGTLVMPAIARATYESMVQRGVDMSLATCRPGNLDGYRRMGARPYGTTLLEQPVGHVVAVLSVLSDAKYMKAMKSPVAHLVGRYFGTGKRPPVDPSPIAHLLADETVPVETEGAKVLAALSELAREGTQAASATLFSGLSPRAMKLVADHGVILRFPPGMLLTTEGHAERELYIVLDGRFEATSGGRVLSTMTRGEVVGDVAFLRESGTRSASVRAATAGQVVAIRRKFLDRLRAVDPDAAHRLLLNLARVPAERLARQGS